jgi:hypothetical protein
MVSVVSDWYVTFAREQAATSAVYSPMVRARARVCVCV